MNSVQEIAACFGLDIIFWQKKRSIYRVRDCKGREFAIKPARQGLSSLNLSIQVHQKADTVIPGFLPALQPTVEGRHFLTYHGTHFLCMPWVQGRELDYLRVSDRKRAVDVLGWWRRIAVEDIPPTLRFGLRRPKVWAERLEEMARCRQMAIREETAFSRLYLRDWEFFYRQAQAALEALEKSAYRIFAEQAMEKGELYHGDWAHHNLLAKPDGRMTILDLEYLQSDVQVMNLVDLLARFLQLSPEDRRIIPDFFRWYDAIYRLTPMEKGVFWTLFHWPADFWMLGRQYFIERLPRSEDFSVMRYQRKIPSPDRWQGWMRRTGDVLGVWVEGMSQ